MSALQQARDLLDELRSQDKRLVYAARKGITAGVAYRHNMTKMFRKVDGKIRFEIIGLTDGNHRGGKDRKHFDLPPDLEKEVQKFLDSL